MPVSLWYNNKEKKKHNTKKDVSTTAPLHIYSTFRFKFLYFSYALSPLDGEHCDDSNNVTMHNLIARTAILMVLT